VGEAVEVGGRTVGDQAHVLAHCIEPTCLAEQGLDLVQFHETLNLRAVSEWVRILWIHVERQRHGCAVAHRACCGTPNVVGDQVQCPEAVVVAPSAPVRQLLEVSDHLCVLRFP
jgi:hypothetical protein